MPVKAIKLGFLGLNTLKIDEMRHHFEQVIGLDTSEQAAGDTYFACGNENVAFSLHRSDAPGYKHLGFQVAGEGPLDDVVAALRESGIAATLKSDVLPGVPSVVEINDLDGHRILLYRESARAPLNVPARGIAPEKLGHVALFSGDPGRSLDFFCQNLGFRWSDWLADILVFLRCNADHHALNFLRAPRAGLFHVAFQLRDWSHLGQACDKLALADVPIEWGPGRHATGHNLFTYHRDPDNNIIELFTDLDMMISEELGYFTPRPHHRDSPQKPKVWSFEEGHCWGPLQPPSFLK
jgi:catechol-2,3-dioxygenase